MLVACVFYYTPFGIWGLRLVERILDVVWGDFHRVYCQDLAGLQKGWAERGERPVLIASDLPQHELVRLLALSDIPCILILDEPESIIELVVYEHRAPPLEALRGCTRLFAAYAQAQSIESALVLRRAHADAPLDHIVRRIVTQILNKDAPDEVERIVSAVSTATPEVPVARASGTELVNVALNGDAARRTMPSQDEIRIIKIVTDDYRRFYEPEDACVIHWPRELFFTSNPDQGRPEDIRLAGVARQLLRGPYCYLPRGRWRLTVSFEISDAISGDQVEADIALSGMAVIARGAFALPARGIFQYTMDFSVDDIAVPIEMRLHLQRAAIRGVMCLRSVTATRIMTAMAPLRPAMPARLEDLT